MRQGAQLKSLHAMRPRTIITSFITFIVAILTIATNQLLLRSVPGFGPYVFDLLVLILGSLCYVGVLKGYGFYRLFLYVLQFLLFIVNVEFLRHPVPLSGGIALLGVFCTLIAFGFLLVFKSSMWLRATRLARQGKLTEEYIDMVKMAEPSAEKMAEFKRIIETPPKSIVAAKWFVAMLFVLDCAMLVILFFSGRYAPDTIWHVAIGAVKNLLIYIALMLPIMWVLEIFIILLYLGVALASIIFVLFLFMPTQHEIVVLLTLFFGIALNAILLYLLANKKASLWRKARWAIKRV